VKKEAKVMSMLVTAVLMCWHSAWLHGSERAWIQRHYSCQDSFLLKHIISCCVRACVPLLHNINLHNTKIMLQNTTHTGSATNLV
jgi:hypothetical protein